MRTGKGEIPPAGSVFGQRRLSVGTIWPDCSRRKPRHLVNWPCGSDGHAVVFVVRYSYGTLTQNSDGGGYGAMGQWGTKGLVVEDGETS